MHIKKLPPALVLIIFLASCASTSKPKHPTNHNFVNISGSYEQIVTINDIPEAIINRLKYQDKDCPGVANPYEEYNSSCAVGYEGMPCRKLLSGGHFNDIWFFEYLTGGAASVQRFVAIKLESNRVVSLLSYGFNEVANNHGVIKLSTRKLADLMPQTPVCSDVKFEQYSLEVTYGLCVPNENTPYTYRRFIPAQ